MPNERLGDIMAAAFALANRDFSRRALVLDDGSDYDGLAAAVNMVMEEIQGYLLEKEAAETELRRSEAALRQAQKMETAGRLAGGVAHDFNNILTVILSHAELMMDELPTGDPMRDDLEEMRSAAQRGASLTRQLLLFSRHEANEPQRLDVGKLLRELSRMLQRIVGEDIKLVPIVPDDLPGVLGIGVHLEQVIVNLVVNARDAMPTGGTITIETSSVELDRGPHLLLSVKDTGIGMDEQTLGHIFEPFFTTKGPGKGTGLGLSTVFGIVEKMAGWIDVTSVLGQGTTFRIYMPIAPGSQTADDTQRLDLPLTANPTQTILLVEDEAPVRNVIATILRRQGYQVLEAGTAAQAVRQVAKHSGRIDLLITDIVMPNISGAELSRWLHEMRPDMRILYISGYTDDHIARHDLRGATLLEKPFTRESLAMKVRAVLEAA